MNTKNNKTLEEALKNLPQGFKSKLIKEYTDFKRNCSEARFESAGLSAGKFCEIILRLLQEKVFGKFTPFGEQIGTFADECRKIITAPASKAVESEKTVIPRAIVLLYTIRNKRGIGHVGGDVDANSIDIYLMKSIADWIVCELIRIYHNLSLEEAQSIIESIAIKELPSIWEVGGKKRVLKEGLSKTDETLLLLYSSMETGILIEDIFSWTEYSNMNVFKEKVIKKLHSNRLIEYDKDTESVYLSPKGARYVEEKIL
ncbi:MAG: hypothetical protein IPO06_06265 [Leptospiraceae bacterium]|nr:hypothetical protein [Leptospiraceae bacterium]MBK7055150.1 hypothetical protein [Leptospiraceae bacterium]MBK9498986.1 hypothetical protein [Leptospiraceae bacterium]MBP9887621.1 hypothetical protein [Leptospiraceae bacterium]